jgi:MoaA/NifB/PqqE/SkfB family radical SAM enzyme
MTAKGIFGFLLRLLKDEQRGGAAAEPAAKVGGKDTFCVLAFNHLQIAPNGTVKMCCIAGEDISDGGRAMSLYSDTYEDIWNSKYMRDARRGMAAGEEISACARCYREEASVGQSRRITQNAVWLAASGKQPEEFLETAATDEWKVASRPEVLQLNMGNLCNLACRMCSSQYSSRIENDPVHNKWMPAVYPDVARWRSNNLHFAPRSHFGVGYQGFYDYEGGPFGGLRWTNGGGKISLAIPPGAGVDAIGLALRGYKNNLPLSIRVNGLELFHGEISGDWKQRFERHGLDNQPEIEIEFISRAEMIGGRQLGVALLDAWLERQPSQIKAASNERALTRFSRNEGWWANHDVMFGEILSEPNRLRCITFQGGEPLLVKEFDEILDLLIANDAASHVTFEIVSNMTVLKQSTLEKLAQLKQVHLCASIDGIGSYLEYIRYPALWSDIEKNLAQIAALPNVVRTFSVAVQLYNLLHVTDILRYCDENAIDAYTHFLVGPQYLNVLVLPKEVRKIAAERLRHYLEGDCRSQNIESARYMLTFLAEHESIHYRADFPNFLKFTNDMDKSRHQNFEALYSDHIAWFAKDGLDWTDETAFAGGV